MSRLYEFKAIIHWNPERDAAYIEIPWAARKEFIKERIPVQATFDGYPYGGQLVKMGTTGHIISIPTDIRLSIGKRPGDEIFATIRERNED